MWHILAFRYVNCESVIPFMAYTSVYESCMGEVESALFQPGNVAFLATMVA
jgi:hypothetical protein